MREGIGCREWEDNYSRDWKENQHHLIDALAEADAEGQPQAEAIEEYLGTI
jgi:hypothetical protein